MDISEQYIKMCDCPEIQGKWEIGVDAMMHPATDPHDYTQMILKPHPKYKTQQACITIWLPRQDQIQAMISDGEPTKGTLYKFHEFYTKEGYRIKTVGEPVHFTFRPLDCLDTPEQLWLAFYMSENRQKIWDGKEWIK